MGRFLHRWSFCSLSIGRKILLCCLHCLLLLVMRWSSICGFALWGLIRARFDIIRILVVCSEFGLFRRLLFIIQVTIIKLASCTPWSCPYLWLQTLGSHIFLYPQCNNLLWEIMPTTLTLSFHTISCTYFVMHRWISFLLFSHHWRSCLFIWNRSRMLCKVILGDERVRNGPIGRGRRCQSTAKSMHCLKSKSKCSLHLKIS